PPTEEVPTEHYRTGQRLRVYVYDVRRTQGRILQILVSRTHRDLVRRLFEAEVPEIYEGTVEIKAIAREPGSRSKVAVVARQEGQNARLAAKLTGWRVDENKPVEGEVYEERKENVYEHAPTSQMIRRERGERSGGRHERNGCGGGERGDGGPRRGGSAHRSGG